MQPGPEKGRGLMIERPEWLENSISEQVTTNLRPNIKK